MANSEIRDAGQEGTERELVAAFQRWARDVYKPIDPLCDILEFDRLSDAPVRWKSDFTQFAWCVWRDLQKTVEAVRHVPVSAPVPERTNKDYAIEHGGYLATAAENYLNERNRYGIAVAGYADENAEIPNADSLADHHQALRVAIYEFRKRRDRALAAPVPEPEPAAKPAPGDCSSLDHEFPDGHPYIPSCYKWEKRP